MTQHIVCVTAGQRSGTNALRNALADTGRFANLGEIFNTATPDWPGNFFAFCRKRGVGYGDIQSGFDAESLCNAFMAELYEKAGNAHLLFDVKFNSWGEIRASWTFLHEEPYFLTYLKSREAKIIFVWRRDIVAQVMSNRIAARIGKSHNIKAKDVVDPIVLDVEENRKLAKLLCQSEFYFWESLKAYPFCVALCYEEMFEGERALSMKTRVKCCELMGESLKFRETGYFHKNELDKETLISNYTDVAQAIIESATLWRKDFLTQMAARG